ncbi:hypothetical protein ABPG74_021206 [Tetrahymena malaccensis]
MMGFVNTDVKQVWRTKLIENLNQFQILATFFITCSIISLCFFKLVKKDINMVHLISLSVMCLISIQLSKYKIQALKRDNNKQIFPYLFEVFMLLSTILGVLFYYQVDISSQVFCSKFFINSLFFYLEAFFQKDYIIQHSSPVSGTIIVDQLNILAQNNSCYSFKGINQEEEKNQLFHLSNQIIRRVCNLMQNSQECYQIDSLIIIPFSLTYTILQWVILIGFLNIIVIIYIIRQAYQSHLKQEPGILKQKSKNLDQANYELCYQPKSVENQSEFVVQPIVLSKIYQ